MATCFKEYLLIIYIPYRNIKFLKALKKMKKIYLKIFEEGLALKIVKPIHIG